MNLQDNHVYVRAVDRKIVRSRHQPDTNAGIDPKAPRQRIGACGESHILFRSGRDVLEEGHRHQYDARQDERERAEATALGGA